MIIIVIIVTIAYFIGYYRGEGAKERKKETCNGKKHTINRTGYREESFKRGNPKWHCSPCGRHFNEDMVEIPELVGEIISKKELANMFPDMFGKEWEIILRYIKENI